jgi:hypothetical protein
MKRLALSGVCIALIGCLPAVAYADTIKIGRWSQQEGPGKASVGASISSNGVRPVPDRHGETRAAHEQVISLPRGGGGREDVVSYPTLPSGSPLLRNPQPYGPNTFWYTDGSGHACVFLGDGSPLCYTVTTAGGRIAGGPRLDPAAIAAALATRLDLFPGRIQASPSASRGGLTGVHSWFWLAPAPRRERLSISLGGERVSVTAVPGVAWRFGDGAALFGGAGRAYAPGPPPAGSIRHLYETRCLPGDLGRNPYVLSSCSTRGYPVAALVHWTITFEASGPIVASGSLPSRTTTTGRAYPVSEARAFLVGGGNG